MKKINKLLFLPIGLLMVFAANASAEDDFQYWSRLSVKAIDTKYVDFVNYWDLRLFNDASRPGLWLTSQKLQFDFFKNLGFAIGYSYLENKVRNTKSGSEEFKFQHRLELEANPRWKIKERLAILNRNRIEFRWIEDRGSDHGRFRHMWEFEFPLKFKPIPNLKSIYSNNEIFIDFNKHELGENRCTPIGIGFKIYKDSSIKVFYMIQSKKGARDWSSNQILGSHVTVSF